MGHGAAVWAWGRVAQSDSKKPGSRVGGGVGVGGAVLAFWVQLDVTPGRRGTEWGGRWGCVL